MALKPDKIRKDMTFDTFTDAIYLINAQEPEIHIAVMRFWHHPFT